MLLDALNAERYRLTRDRGAVFWAFVFPGLATFLLAIGASLFARFVLHERMPGTVNLLGDATGALSGSGSPVTQLFFILGAVATFGADYRWETWRLQTPRNSRMNLMLAKFVVFALAAAIGLLLMPLGGFLGALLRVVIEGSHVDLPSLGPWFLGFLRAFAGSWLETLVVGGVAAFIAVATRSNVAAIIVTLLAAFAQAITLGIVTAIPKPITLDQMATFPSLAGQVVRGQPIGPDQVVVAGAPIAALFLILWLAVLAAATIALFQRQELTRE